jgi:hypothetical protein
MENLDAILLWEKLEIEASNDDLRLEISSKSIQIFIDDNFLSSVKSVEALNAFIKGYRMGKTGDIPTQHDFI